MRYFFSCEGAQNFRDEEGTELADLNEARLQAVQNASEILRDKPEAFATSSRWRAYVTDAAGSTVFVLNLSTELREP